MLNGHFQGQVLGACTDCRRLTAEFEAGTLDAETYRAIEDGIVRSAGHCMVMGTASTMNSLVEALGIALPGNGAIPAPDARRLRLAEAAGRRIVDLVREGLRPSRILTEAAFENAITLLHALGGSTNAVVHLAAIAGRVGVPLPLERFDTLSRRTPVIANVRPAGQYQMEELFLAGGIPAVLRQLLPLLNRDALTVTGRTLAETVQYARVENADVIRSLDKPLTPEGGLAVLRGNLAPDGALIKHAAATPQLLRHRGRAVVFQGLDDLRVRLDNPELEVQEDDVLVLQGVGPIGGPGMPEVGNFPIPGKLLRAGVRDMVRVSDGRMSGTAFGTIVLHVAPESAVGGPLALVRTGDEIELDVAERRVHLRVEDRALERRRAEWRPPDTTFARGYGRLYLEHVNQAPGGCDFDFLRGADPVIAAEQPKF
jgi:dihydroxy-acid dehydratase